MRLRAWQRQLQSGKAALALPEHFGLVNESSGLTVQLTPRGEGLQLYVVELDTTHLVVREAQGKSGTFDYLFQGMRKGSEPHEVIRLRHSLDQRKRDFLPIIFPRECVPHSALH